MYHQNACLFYNQISYDREYSGLSTDEEEGMRTAKQLGNKSVLFMCNHGVLVVAPNAARAMDHTYYLERACMNQVRCAGLLWFILTSTKAGIHDVVSDCTICIRYMYMYKGIRLQR